jgi:hypothetical protein
MHGTQDIGLDIFHPIVGILVRGSGVYHEFWFEIVKALIDQTCICDAAFHDLEIGVWLEVVPSSGLVIVYDQDLVALCQEFIGKV